MPQKSQLWDVEPDSTWATIKQTIAIMRAIVSIALTLLIVSVVITSEGIIGRVPDEITRYMEPAITAPGGSEVVTLRVTESPGARAGVTMYVGRMEPRAAARGKSGAPGALDQSSASMTAAGESVIYVVAAPTIVRRLLQKSFLPSYFQVAWLGAVLCGLFTLGIFFMELMSNALREGRPGDLVALQS
jgi:hypothetical protein